MSGVLQRWQAPLGKARWRRRLKWLTALTVVAGVVALAMLLPAVGGYLRYAKGWQRADVAVVLAGEFPNRVMEAAQLYRDDRVGLILLTRQQESAGYERLRDWQIRMPEQQDLNYQLLLSAGVPAAKIARLPYPATNTHEEATYTRRWLELSPAIAESRLPRLLVVTSATHTRRAYLVFAAELGKQAQIGVEPSRFDDFDRQNWWRQPLQWKNVVLEYQKLLLRALTAD